MNYDYRYMTNFDDFVTTGEHEAILELFVDALPHGSGIDSTCG